MVKALGPRNEPSSEAFKASPSILLAFLHVGAFNFIRYFLHKPANKSWLTTATVCGHYDVITLREFYHLAFQIWRAPQKTRSKCTNLIPADILSLMRFGTSWDSNKVWKLHKMYTCAWEQSTHSNQSSIYLKTSVNTPLAWLKSTCTTAAIQTPGRTTQESYDLTNSTECQSSFILGRIISTNKLFCTSKLGEKTTKHETNKWRGYKHTQPDCCSLKFQELDS